MVEIIELITFVAIVLYILFGGADYGAGILGLFKSKAFGSAHDETIDKAIGPVWEANHIWLILVVVIFFNGFPTFYTTISTYLHIPVVALLVGIITRGASFTMRHYDVFPHKPTRLYDASFSFGSLWAAIWLGVIAGACMLGKISPNAGTFYGLYVAPWWNAFSFSVGFFTAAVFTFLAATFLIGESQEAELKKYFMKRAWIANVAVVVSGAVVFVVAEKQEFPLLRMFLQNKGSVTMGVVATILWVVQSSLRHRLNVFLSRATAAGQIVCVLLGFLFVAHPTIIATTNGPLTFANSAAPAATLFQLLVALSVGLIVILPSLGVLLWVFKYRR